MKNLIVIFLAALVLFCATPSNAQFIYTNTQYGFQASYPGAAVTQDPLNTTDTSFQFVAYSQDHHLIAGVQYNPLPTATFDKSSWTFYNQSVEKGGTDATDTLTLNDCSVEQFNGYPAESCSMTVMVGNAHVTGQMLSIWRGDKHVMYVVYAEYAVGSPHSDSEVSAFVNSFGFLQ